jgi:hypothetical protein
MTPLKVRDCSQSMDSGGPDIAASAATMVKLKMPIKDKERVFI